MTMPIAEPSKMLAGAPALDIDPSRVTATIPSAIASRSSDLEDSIVHSVVPPTEVPSESSTTVTAVSSTALPPKSSDSGAGFKQSQTDHSIPSASSSAITLTLPIDAPCEAPSKFDDPTGQNNVVPSTSSSVLNSAIPNPCSAASSDGSERGGDSIDLRTAELREVPSGSSEALKTNGDVTCSENHVENEVARSLDGTLLNNSEDNQGKESDASRLTLGNDLVVDERDLKDLVDTEAWRAGERHVFVLSSSGKPVYSRHGSEDKLVTLFGVMQALVSIVEDGDDRIESIHFGKNVIVFQIQGPIILVAVSKKNDSVLFCNNELTYVYNQIVSVLTLKQVTSIFERRRNYDLRRLLTGSERLIDHLLNFYETEPSIFMNGISCIPMPSAHREAISSAIITACSKIKNMVFAVLVANNKLISLARKRGYSMSPSDLHLILNMVAASESLKTAESWTPICLPNFNADGFLYAHVSYLSDDCPACLLLLTVDQEIFFRLSEAKTKITEKLSKNKSMSLINEVLKAPPSLWLSLHALGLSKIRHFIYKCRKTSNVVSSPMTPPYDTPQEATALFTKYQQLYSAMIESNPQVHSLFQVSAEESVVCLLTEKFEILVALEPMVKKQLALALITKLSQWVQSEEDRFFLSNVPYL